MTWPRNWVVFISVQCTPAAFSTVKCHKFEIFKAKWAETFVAVSYFGPLSWLHWNMMLMWVQVLYCDAGWLLQWKDAAAGELMDSKLKCVFEMPAQDESLRQQVCLCSLTQAVSNNKLKVDIYILPLTRTWPAVVYNAKWRTDQQWQVVQRK